MGRALDELEAVAGGIYEPVGPDSSRGYILLIEALPIRARAGAGRLPGKFYLFSRSGEGRCLQFPTSSLNYNFLKYHGRRW